MRPSTILVIDDEKEFATLVRRALEREGFDVIVAPDGRTGLSIAEKHHPDLVVLDLTMPDLDGLEVCRMLRADPRNRRLPILMLSARASAPERVLGLDTGADDYLVKPFVPEELAARVKALLRRASADETSATVITVGELRVDLGAHQTRVGDQLISLTGAQQRVLEFMAIRAGRVVSRDEVIEAALRDDRQVTERTVDAHIVGIRKALGPTAAELIQTVRSFGYALRKE